MGDRFETWNCWHIVGFDLYIATKISSQWYLRIRGTTLLGFDMPTGVSDTCYSTHDVALLYWDLTYQLG